MSANEVEFEKKIVDLLESNIQKARENPDAILSMIAAYYEASSDRMATAMHYREDILSVCDKWAQDRNVATGARYLVNALYKYASTHFDEAIQLAIEAQDIFLTTKKYEAYGIACMVRGSTYRSMGEFDKAVKYLLMGENNIDPNGMFSSYASYSHYHLAEIYFQMKDMDAAKTSYLKAVEYADKTGKIMPVFRSYNGLGNYYLSTGEYEKGFECIDLALKVANNETQTARALCDLGIYFLSIKDYNSAIEKLSESLKLRQKLEMEDAASTSMMYMSKAYLQKGLIEKARELAQIALDTTVKFQVKSKMVYCYQLMGLILEAEGKFEEALSYLHKYEDLEQELNNHQMQNIYKLKNRLIEDQKTQIEIAHKEITDSIAYAKRIQTAILPPKNLMNNNLNDHFVLYKPKDIVAGDFYWLETITSTSDSAKDGEPQTILFAACDCTGHGVPGAMVSVVCHNALNRSVREFGLRKPGEILDKTRKIIIEEFEKAEEDVKDGMDICLCAMEGNLLRFSGAHNDLWLIRNGELTEYKGDKQPVGKFSAAHNFTTHNIQLEPGDFFYIMTDGYADQFGGENGKKFKAKQLKELLLKIHSKPCDEQEQILSDVFENWRGKLEQVDDVCLIGV